MRNASRAARKTPIFARKQPTPARAQAGEDDAAEGVYRQAPRFDDRWQAGVAGDRRRRQAGVGDEDAVAAEARVGPPVGGEALDQHAGRRVEQGGDRVVGRRRGGFQAHGGCDVDAPLPVDSQRRQAGAGRAGRKAEWRGAPGAEAAVDRA
ncbi:MAG TPA: hypothetical protein VJL81_02940 [Solirubrobacterales bacterium]|nr:hypothetical protein [Solirubrobacterales bacterium]